MNTDVMFSSKSDLWSTPQDLFDELNAEFGFTLDTCALPENAKCARYYTPETNGLVQKWEGVCWCNPPYGRQIGKWVQKAATTNALVVMLLPARTDTKWFHDYIYYKSNVAVRFIRGRLKFGGAQSSAPFPSMIVIFNGRTNMERLTDRRTAQQVRENIEKLRAAGIEPSVGDARYVKLAEYENAEENEKEKKLMKEMVYQATRLNPPELLDSGEVKGYNYYVLSQGTHPCGYVEIPSESRFFNVDYDDIPVDCHGGLTYGRGYLTGVAEEAENRYFIGWDYAHYCDYMGYYSTYELSGAMHYTGEIVRECKNVIAQLIELEDVSDNNVGKKED